MSEFSTNSDSSVAMNNLVQNTMPQKIHILILLFCVIVCNNVLLITPVRTSMAIYYILLIFLQFIFLLYSLKHPTNIKIYPNIFLLWGVMWLSIFVNWQKILPDFRVLERNMAFFLVVISIGPYFASTKLFLIRIHLFKILNSLMLFIVFVSFIGYLSHIFPIRQGFYLGCVHHSMLLGFICGITALNCAHAAFAQSGKQHLYYLFSFVVAVLTCFLASSRTSVGAFLCAACVLLYLSFKNRFSRLLKIAMVFLFIASILLQYTGSITEGIKKKMHNEYSIETALSNRTPIWLDRWNEFVHNPILGVGAHSIRLEYCSSSVTFSSHGLLEPGNSWLFWLSSTGIIGFLVFLFAYLDICLGLYRRNNGNDIHALLLAIFVFFAVYMNGEAHITASGDFTFIYFWLVAGISMPQTVELLKNNKISSFYIPHF